MVLFDYRRIRKKVYIRYSFVNLRNRVENRACETALYSHAASTHINYWNIRNTIGSDRHIYSLREKNIIVHIKASLFLVDLGTNESI